MDALDRFQVELSSGPLDESEVQRVREGILIRDSEVHRLEQRVRSAESKLNRIWYILTVLGFLAWAWIDGRFGLSAPNAVLSGPAVVEVKSFEDVSLLATDVTSEDQ